MKKTALLFLAIGLIGGLAIGRISTPTPPLPEPEPPAEPKPVRPNPPKEQELLLQAIHELDLTSAELDDALQYIQKLERNTQRYNWLMDYWKEKGFGRSYEMRFGDYGGSSLTPSDDLIEFFGWDKTQVTEMNRIGKVTVTAIKDWESKHSVLIEDSEKKVVYEIEAIPEETIGQYLQSMEEILDPDDMELLSSKFEEQFNGPLQDRILTITIGPESAAMNFSSNDDPDQEYMTIQTRPKEIGPSFSGGGFSSSASPYTPGMIFPHSWNHVLKMEGTPAIISDTPGEWNPVN